MEKIKYKIYNSDKKEVNEYVNASIAIDGGVQTFGKDGRIQGTLINRHLVPMLYAGKKDIDGNEIFDGYIVKRESTGPGEEDIVGAVVFDECSWWIENRKEGRAVRLFSETAVDKIVGNLFQDVELSESIGF